MTKGRKILTYATGFALGCLILLALPREVDRPREHPWHAQTAPEGTYPMEVTDDLSRTVHLDDQPRHFISLAPSITEMLFAMEMGDHLMAVTRWCTYPEAAKALRDAGAHIGSMDQPDRELIATYRPDLILGTDLTPSEVYSLLENPPGTVALALAHESIDDVLEDIKTIGLATGVPGKAVRLISKLKTEIARTETLVEAHRSAPPPRVLVLLSIEADNQPGWTPGEGTWVDDLLEKAHAVNAAAEMGPSWGEVSLEALMAMDPEIILLRKGNSEEEQQQLTRIVQGLRSHPVWSTLQAVREDRVHWLPNGPLSIPGPRIGEAFGAIAQAIWEGADKADLSDTHSGH